MIMAEYDICLVDAYDLIIDCYELLVQPHESHI